MNIFYKKTLMKIMNNGKTLSVAESCTGGRICNEMAKIPGISKIFLLGIVAYSNNSKISTLKINSKKLNKYGAVSKEIAKEMAINILKISKSDFSISTTGIAGPTGFSNKKPIGLVYFAIASKKKIHIYKKNFKGSRLSIQKKSTDFAFNILDKFIK